MAIYKKLLDFQKLDITVKADGKNDYFKKEGKPSKYVTLNEVLDKVKKPLNNLGVLIIFQPEAAGLRTILLDTTDDTKVEGYMQYVGADNAQKLLACNTYYRRGSLVALLGLEDEDDDGNAASTPQKQIKALGQTISTPLASQSGSRPIKTPGAKCPDCANGKFMLNPKTNKIFCSEKCWLQPKTTPEPAIDYGEPLFEN
jgi:hypothetical protein